MEFSISQKNRALLTIVSCGLASFLMVKILILDSIRRMSEKQAEMTHIAGKITTQNEELNGIHALLDQIRDEAQQRHSARLAPGIQQTDLIKLVMPDSGISKSALQTMSVDGGIAENYSFSVSIAAGFAETCEYMRWLERDRPQIVIQEVTLSPWQKDTTQVHLQLKGAIQP